MRWLNEGQKVVGGDGFLKAGQLPPPDAVRIEELINYFRFDYPSPEGDAPFSVTTSVAACPWKPAHKLVTVAKDVKIQVEFNPKAVSAFRLIGYENRVLAHEDFNDDGKDAGDIGAGHTVTALYEIVPVGVPLDAGSVDPLKYQQPRSTTVAAGSGELATIKLRYKAPDGEASTPLATSVRDEGGEASANLRFAAAVAEFGMLLRNSEHKGTASFAQALELGRGATGDDPDGFRAEFVGLVEQAQRLAQTKDGLVGS